MNENFKTYRFSLRGLFLFTLACSLLLFEWKMWGLASLLGTLTTLACGAAFVWFIASQPFRNSWKVTIACILNSLGTFVLLHVCTFIAFHLVSYLGWTATSQIRFFNGLGVAFVCLLLVTAFTAWMLRLMMEPKWSFWFPFLIIFNVWFGLLLVEVLTDHDDRHVGQTFGSDVLRGYATAMTVFALALVLRWVKSLPTTRDKLES
jgi:hypothetical protein